MNVSWTQTAFEDLDRIDAYWTSRNPAYGDRLAERIIMRAEKMASMPLAAQRRDDMGPGLRSFTELNYVVFYQPWRDGIVVLRVIHGRRDIRRIMRGLPGAER